MDELILILSDDDSLELVLDSADDLELVLGESDAPVVPPYEGPYTVVSELYDAQTLATNGKRMTDNMTVEPIPVTWTTNLYGGQTVVIG